MRTKRQRNRRKTAVCLEQLDQRIVPATAGAAVGHHAIAATVAAHHLAGHHGSVSQTSLIRHTGSSHAQAHASAVGHVAVKQTVVEAFPTFTPGTFFLLPIGTFNGTTFSTTKPATSTATQFPAFVGIVPGQPFNGPGILLFSGQFGTTGSAVFNITPGLGTNTLLFSGPFATSGSAVFELTPAGTANTLVFSGTFGTSGSALFTFPSGAFNTSPLFVSPGLVI
jgi:hypothetical protein